MRRVAVPQRLAADRRRQDPNGQHRVRGHHSGRSAVGRRGVRAVAQVRAVQHSGGGPQGHPVPSVRPAQDLEELQVGRHRVDSDVRDRDRVRHRLRAAGRRLRVAAVRVRQRHPERGARARPAARHRPVHAAGPVPRRRGGPGRQDTAVRGQPERGEPVRVQAEGAGRREDDDRRRRRRARVRDRRQELRDRLPVAVPDTRHGGAALHGRGRRQDPVRDDRVADVRPLRGVLGSRARQVAAVRPEERPEVRAAVPDAARRGRVPPVRGKRAAGPAARSAAKTGERMSDVRPSSADRALTYVV